MATPVSVLRLPKGPDPNSRGFDPNSPRFIALCRTSISTSAASEADAEELQREQQARSVLRESFLRCLLSMTNKKVQFHMYENVKVDATFGASDIDVLNFQVSDLHTPIGVQKEALIRSQDVISFTFAIWTLKKVFVYSENDTGLKGTWSIICCWEWAVFSHFLRWSIKLFIFLHNDVFVHFCSYSCLYCLLHHLHVWLSIQKSSTDKQSLLFGTRGSPMPVFQVQTKPCQTMLHGA